MPYQYPGFQVPALFMTCQCPNTSPVMIPLTAEYVEVVISLCKVYLFRGVRSLSCEIFASSLLCLTSPSSCLSLIPGAVSPFLKVQSALWQIVAWP